MSAGVVQITVKDSAGVGRPFNFFSSTGDGSLDTGTFAPLSFLGDGMGGYIAPATSTLQAITNTSLASILSALEAGLAVTGPLTATQLTAASLATHADALAIVAALGALPQTNVLATGTNTVGAISNTVFGATQTGAWTVIANAGTGTFAISAAALPLPTGAAKENGGNLDTLVARILPPLTPVSTAALASSLVVKAGAGNLAAIEISSGATAGWLMLFNATAAPADGAVTPVKAYQVPANVTERWEYARPLAFATGITAVFSSTGPFNKTASATVFISGESQ
jgi:hypothetical protein